MRTGKVGGTERRNGGAERQKYYYEFQRSERRDGVPGVNGVQRGRSNKRGNNGQRSKLLECGETE